MHQLAWPIPEARERANRGLDRASVLPRKPGDRIGDEHIDGAEFHTGGSGRVHRHVRQQIDRMLLKNCGALFPAVGLEILLDRLAIVAAVDTSVIAKRAHSLEMRENSSRTLGRFGFSQDERRIGRRNG